MYSEAMSQMHLPHSHLPWLLQMPWDRRGDSRCLRAIADTQWLWDSARCPSSPEGPTLGICLEQWSLGRAGQHLPLGCRCRCRCSWDIHSLGPPSRSRTHRRPWSSGHDLGVTGGVTRAPALCHSSSPVCGSPTFFGVHRGFFLGCKRAANRLHSIPPAHLQAQSPCRPSLVTQPPCQCHQSRTPRLCHQTQHMPQLGDSGVLSPLQRKPEVRGHCSTSNSQKAPSKRRVWSSE